MSRQKMALQPILHRCDSRGRHFLRSPKGFWGPLIQLMEIPFLADMSCAVLNAQRPRRFVLRAASLAYAQDSAARLLPLVLHQTFDDSGDALKMCATPRQVLAVAQNYLRDFPEEMTSVEYADQQVHLCRTLPDVDGKNALLIPAPSANCELPVLIQQRDSLPLDSETLTILEQCKGPVILLQQADGFVPEGWPVWTVPDADPDWLGRLLFELYQKGSPRALSLPDAQAVARGLWERFGPALSEQDLQLAAIFVRNSEGCGCYVSARRFLDLVERMPTRELETGISSLTTLLFRPPEMPPHWELQSPLLAVAAWRRVAEKCPAPYPHPDASVPAGLTETRPITNRMLYDPTRSPGFWGDSGTALVAESCGNFYGLQLWETDDYVSLFAQAQRIGRNRPGLEYWVLVVDRSPEEMKLEDVRHAGYAFHFAPDAVTLYDGTEGLHAFSEAARDFLRKKLAAERNR